MKVLLWRKHDCGMNGVEELPSKYVVKFTGWRSDVHSECDSKIRQFLAASIWQSAGGGIDRHNVLFFLLVFPSSSPGEPQPRKPGQITRNSPSPCFARASRRWAAGRSLNNHLVSLLKLEQRLVEILSCPFRIFIHTAFILHIKK